MNVNIYFSSIGKLKYSILLFTLGRRSKLFSGCEECRYRGHCLSGALAHREVPGIETLVLNSYCNGHGSDYRYSDLHEAVKHIKKGTVFLVPGITKRCWELKL